MKEINQRLPIFISPHQNMSVLLPVSEYSEVHFTPVQRSKRTTKLLFLLLYVDKYPNALKPYARVG